MMHKRFVLLFLLFIIIGGLIFALPVISEGLRLWIASSSPGDRLNTLASTLGALVAAFAIVVSTTLAFRKLAQEREERFKDRSLELKKEVLLEAVRGAGAQIHAIGLIAVVETAVEGIGVAFREAAARTSAAHAVASPSVVRQLRKVSETAGKALSSLMAERSQLDNIHADYQIALNMGQLASEKAQKYLDDRATAIVQGAEQKTLNALGTLVQQNLDRSNEYGQQRDEAAQRLMSARVPFMRRALEQIADCENELRNLVALIRLDMEVDTSSEAYLEASVFDRTEMRRAIDLLEGIVLPVESDDTKCEA